MPRTPPIFATLIATAALACGGDAGERANLDERARITPAAAPAFTTSAPAPAPAVTPPATERVLATDEGEATFYADLLDRKRTASGEPMNQQALVAAHRRYPFGTVLRVTNLANNKSVNVRVIDRGPYGAPKVAARKIIDLSKRAARQIGMLQQGRAVVKVEVLSYGPGLD